MGAFHALFPAAALAAGLQPCCAPPTDGPERTGKFEARTSACLISIRRDLAWPTERVALGRQLVVRRKQERRVVRLVVDDGDEAEDGDVGNHDEGRLLRDRASRADRREDVVELKGAEAGERAAGGPSSFTSCSHSSPSGTSATSVQSCGATNAGGRAGLTLRSRRARAAAARRTLPAASREAGLESRHEIHDLSPPPPRGRTLRRGRAPARSPSRAPVGLRRPISVRVF